MPKGQPFSGEFKQRVVEDVLNNNVGYNEAMKKYGIKGRSKIQQWERIYLTEGAEALYVDHRGLKSTGRPAKFPKQVEEDLLAENQRLRMEIDYLKKLNALVSKEEQQNRKRK
jgi:Transposase and inactivated derivatives